MEEKTSCQLCFSWQTLKLVKEKNKAGSMGCCGEGLPAFLSFWISHGCTFCIKIMGVYQCLKWTDGGGGASTGRLRCYWSEHVCLGYTVIHLIIARNSGTWEQPLLWIKCEEENTVLELCSPFQESTFNTSFVNISDVRPVSQSLSKKSIHFPIVWNLKYAYKLKVLHEAVKRSRYRNVSLFLLTVFSSSSHFVPLKHLHCSFR